MVKEIALPAILVISILTIYQYLQIGAGRKTVFVQRSERKALTVERHLGKSVPEADERAPKIAWILAYPCSGSDLVVDIIHQLTGKTTATNYGHLVEEATGITARNVYQSMPVFVERVNGPFIYSNYLPLPVKTYIPTLTHCGGYCAHCYPGKYIMKRDAFIAQCLNGTRFTPSVYNNGENGYGFTEQVQYWGELVKKSGIIVRNPIDIIQTRFLYYSNMYTKNLEWAKRYDQSRKGFLSFCDESKTKYAEFEDEHWPEGARAKGLHIPCYAEIFKLVQWHNLVCETIEFMDVPHKVFYYEQFVKGDYVENVEMLLNFYELANVVPIKEETKPHEVRLNQELYSTTEREDAQDYIKFLANDCTKNMLDRYL